MLSKKTRLTMVFLAAALSIIALFAVFGYGIRSQRITIVEAKIADAVDENLMPVNVMNVFPKGTSKVSCWIKWRDAKINTQILAKWHYVTDDIPILDYVFNIPKKDSMGSVILSMPRGENLPSGLYKVDLILGKRLLRSLAFTIE